MIEPDGFLARFQAFEYALAFRIGRESLADYSITSGVSFYRRDALARALNEHTLSVYAEDLRERVDPAEPRRAHLLRRAPGRQHRRTRQRAALVLTARGLVLRAGQGLHRALRRDLAHQQAHAVRHVSLHHLCRWAVAGPASAEDRQRAAAGAELHQRLRQAVPGATVAAQRAHQSELFHRGGRQLPRAGRVRAVHGRAESRSAPTSRRSCRCICSTPSLTSCR